MKNINVLSSIQVQFLDEMCGVQIFLQHEKHITHIHDDTALIVGQILDVAAHAYALSRLLKIGAPDTALFAGILRNVGQFFLLARASRYRS